MTKIVIGTPVHSYVSAGYAYSLARMIHYTGRIGIGGEKPELDYVQVVGSNLVGNRNEIVQVAFESGADHLLWLDSDMNFPPDTLIRLMSHGLDVVGCNYPRRIGDPIPTATTKQGGKRIGVWTDEESAKAGKVEAVASLGLGCCLVSTAAMRKMSLPWFDWGTNGEDGFYFAGLRMAGYRVMLDHGLSWEIGHIVERYIQNVESLKFRS